MNDKQRGLIAIVAANVIFGINIPLTKFLMSEWMTPIGYTATRMAYGALAFWVIGLFTSSEKVKPQDLLTITLGGLLGFLGTQFLFSRSLQDTSPVVFSLLMTLTPVVVVVLSAFLLKESIPRKKILGILVSIAGASLIIFLSNNATDSANATKPIGILFAIMCVLCYAGYLLLTRSVSVKYQPITVAKWMFLSSAVVILPFSFTELPQQQIFTEQPTTLAITALAFALVFSTTIGLFLMPAALKRLEASTISVFMNLQPIVAGLVAVLAGQDHITIQKLMAAVLVLVGVYLVSATPKAKVAKV